MFTLGVLRGLLVELNSLKLEQKQREENGGGYIIYFYTS